MVPKPEQTRVRLRRTCGYDVAVATSTPQRVQYRRQLEAGTAYEAERLARLGVSKNTITWRPTPADIDGAAFR